MAQNPLPKPVGSLLILAGKCGAGLTTYATVLGITQITPASLGRRRRQSVPVIQAFSDLKGLNAHGRSDGIRFD